MKLVDLQPEWLIRNGKRIGLMFRCPLDPGDRNRTQTCFFGKIPRHDQWAAVEAALGEDPRIVQMCNPEEEWKCVPAAEKATFENLSITPSIDGSAGGNWHGYITNGEIR